MNEFGTNNIDKNQKEICKEALLKQRVDTVTTQSTIVNAAIKLAENLNGYVGGSRRFNLQKNNLSTDIDIFFKETQSYDVFCKYLTFVGQQETHTERINRKCSREVPDGYRRVKQEHFEVLDKTITRRLKGQYVLDNMNIDVSCVDELLTIEQEIDHYVEKILQQIYDNQDMVKNF